jgi:beta-galactosidase
MERGCVADQPQHFECAAAERSRRARARRGRSRTAALRENFKLGHLQTFSSLKVICALLAALAAASFATAETPKAVHTFSIGTNDFLLDGARFQIRCGEVHSARVPAEYWRHRLQMAKAMGLNTVCAYLFWNLHEPRQGEFNWSDQANVAEFCRIAQEEGLWVILRPGPYACAEWEMGGFPWWLLKNDDIKLRTRDPVYIAAAKKYLKEVGRVLGPLQITHGGPILMVQVENEYGFFGKDAEYMGAMRQALLDAGFDVPLFACNPPYHLKDGYRSDLFPVVNFGSDPAASFKSLREILPQGPLMCGEFYPGWFDTWGAPHHTGNEARYLTDLEYMLKNGASFSIYMAHGGTTFGLWSGADRPFKPDTSTYDYDAPISEAGWATEKFFKTRDLFAKYLLPGEKIPELPAKNPVITIPATEATGCAPVFANLPAAVSDTTPRTMEKYDQGYGEILYRTILPAGAAGTLEAGEVHDFGYVFLDGERIGVMDRRNRNFKVRLPERKKAAMLDILVEPMGRVNFGAEVHDRKGIHAPVKFTPTDGEATELNGWQVFNLPLDDKMLGGLKFSRSRGDETLTKNELETPHVVSYEKSPVFWRATVNIEKPGDTFLDMRPWGKGVVWVNGHCLGRFWNIGPAQTMYAPGAWLKRGKNEIVILDLLGPEKPVVAGLEQPILNQLRPNLDFARSKRAPVTLKLDSAKPVLAASFPPGATMQEVKFDAAASGRFFCIESLNAHDGKQFAAIAELDLLDADGKPLSHEGWTVAYVDSEERDKEDGTAENAIDGQTANFWHTQWGDAQPEHPHRLVLDLVKSQTISGFRYVPRQGAGAVGGRIKDYRIYVGDGLVQK